MEVTSATSGTVYGITIPSNTSNNTITFNSPVATDFSFHPEVHHMVDPQILTFKAIVLALVLYQVFVHTWVWERARMFNSNDDIADSILSRFMLTFLSGVVGLAAAAVLYCLYWFFFVWS